MATIEMLDDFVWWGTHCPMWQLYVGMGVALVILILLIASIVRAMRWPKMDTATRRLGHVLIVGVEFVETGSHAIAVRNVNAEITATKLDKISQVASGTKTDCSLSQTSAEYVPSQSFQ